MQYFDWNSDKNEKLKAERGLSFEDVLASIENGLLFDTIDHVGQKKYPGQKIFIVQISDYVCAVPFIEKNNVIFLKTIYKSRKATKKYLRKGAGHV